ncbi:histidine kinase dimerization/phosphoacceptor domain -containing protein [Rudanella lutea]|uniref:histidine kinase dimerization/phosphoacceptor domain -containing protein n=1 Tax=Rudanella lutea TaxID=451374 RepID=UPI001B7FD21F|nr:histidine kinase dimerization/phosphoacceptor domain -containing protein [Rudanella lutea]
MPHLTWIRQAHNMVARRLFCLTCFAGCLLLAGTPFSYSQIRPLTRTDSLQIEAWYTQWQDLRPVRPDSSLVYAQRIHDWGKQHRQPVIWARGLAYLSAEARDKGNFNRSVVLMQQALPVFERHRYLPGIAFANQGLALTYKRMADAQKMEGFTRLALQYAKQALVLNEQLGSATAIANTYNTIGIIQRDLKAYEEARQAYRAGISLLEKEGISNNTLAILYGNMGQLSIEPDRQFERAIDYLERALALNGEARRLTNLEHNHRNLSDLYQRLQKHQKAVFHGEQSVRLANQLGDPHRLFNSLGVAYKAYRDAGHFEQALHYLEQAKVIEDSLGRADKTGQIARLQAAFDNERALQLAEVEAEKQKQIASLKTSLLLQHERLVAQIQADRDRDLLLIKKRTDLARAQNLAEVNARFVSRQKETSIQQLQTQNELQQRQLTWLGWGAGLFFVLSGLLFWQYQRLGQSQAQIKQQSAQLRLLMRELHHRVKNNLAIVSGLLELQSNRLADENAKRAFREGQQRVQAMSLLHQRLYQTDSLTTIDMGEYVASLIESLMGAYGYTHQTVDTRVQVSKQEVDVDLAIPIGLILNEILTNTFKYALPYTAAPSLLVDLRRQGDSLLMHVADNGPGLDLTRWQRPGGSFGKRLIAGLSDQIGGTVSVESGNGTQFFIRVPVNEPSPVRAA